MTDSTTTSPPPTRAATHAERRRLVESVRAHRRLSAGRRSFELADLRRLNREAGQRARAEARRGKALQRIHEKQTRRERSLTAKLNGLDGKRAAKERQALAVLRRESIERSLRGTRLTTSQVNGIGGGLVRDLAAQGITTAADFRRVSWGTAPNGRGGEVLYIHRTQGGKVHINGIGEHRGRPLMEWRRAAVARAEARAPQELPADERHRVEEIIENERIRLRGELAEVPKAAEAARADVEQLHAEHLATLAAREREALAEASLRRAEFDETADRLLALRSELAAHVELHGDLGLRERRARSRALRPLRDALPAIPAQRSRRHTPEGTGAPTEPGESGAAPAGSGPPAAPAASGVPEAAGVRAGLGWLVPLAFFGMTTVFGAGETDDSPLWFSVSTRLVALAVVAGLLCLWIPRRRWRTARPMPAGTGWLVSGVFLGLVAASMFTDGAERAGGAPWALAVVAVLLVLAGVGLRTSGGRDASASD